MFKNLIVYKFDGDKFTADIEAAEAAAQTAVFTPCGATQEQSYGWVPPRGEAEGALVESVGGQWIMKFVAETKSVPGSVIARKVQEKAEAIEAREGRQPGKKERREIKDEVKLDLLPYAFARRSATTVWIDPKAHTVAIDASSQAKADAVITVLVNIFPKFAVALVDTQTSPQAAMAHWLVEGEAPDDFYIDRDCELKACDESRAAVKYARHPLTIDEIREHIEQGKVPTKLAMTWDDRVSFVLTDSLQIKKIKFMDSVLDGVRDEDEDLFDTDVAIATGELSKLIPALVKALGGEGRTA